MSRESSNSLHLTSPVFQWLCDIGAVAPNGAFGSMAGGVLLTPIEQDSLVSGEPLITALNSLDKGLLSDVDSRPFRSQKASPAAASRMHNWATLLECKARLLNLQVNENEKALVVAKDLAVISSVIHKLAAILALSATARLKRTPIPQYAPRKGYISEPVSILAEIGESHFRLPRAKLETIMTDKADRFIPFMLDSDSESQQPSQSDMKLAAWLDDVYTQTYRIVEALRRDNNAIAAVLHLLMAGIHSQSEDVVDLAARVVGALVEEVWGEIVWVWYLADPDGDDGLSNILRAFKSQELISAHGANGRISRIGTAGPSAKVQALSDLMIRAARKENIAHVLTVELPIRLNRAGDYSSVVGDLLPILAQDEQHRQELEWHGLVPFLVDHTLSEFRSAFDDAARIASLHLIVQCWRTFPISITGSPGVMEAVMLIFDWRATHAMGPLARSAVLAAGCKLLVVMIEQKCALAGRLYRQLLGLLENNYEDMDFRTKFYEGFTAVLNKSTSMPLRPMVKPITELARQYGCAHIDLDFWIHLATHQRIEPDDCLSLIQLMGWVTLTDEVFCLPSGKSLIKICTTLVRHVIVKNYLSEFVLSVIDCVRRLRADPTDVPTGAVYKDRPDAEDAAYRHCQMLERLIILMAMEPAMQPLVLEACRAAYGPGSNDVLDSIMQSVESKQRVEDFHLPPIQQNQGYAARPRNSRASGRAGYQTEEAIHAGNGSRLGENGREINQIVLPQIVHVENNELKSGPERLKSGPERSQSEPAPPITLNGFHEHKERDPKDEVKKRAQGHKLGVKRNKLGVESKSKAIHQNNDETKEDSRVAEQEEDSRQDARSRALSKQERKYSDRNLLAAKQGSEKRLAGQVSKQPSEKKLGFAKDDVKARIDNKLDRPLRRPGKLKRVPSDGKVSVSLCQAAFKARGFQNAAEVYYFLDPEVHGKLVALEAAKQLKILKLTQPTQAEFHKALHWNVKPERGVTPEEFVDVFSWDPQDKEEANFENMVLQAKTKRRETAATVKRLIAAAERMVNKKLAPDLETALLKAAEQVTVSEPPAPKVHHQPAAKPQAPAKRPPEKKLQMQGKKQRRARDGRARISEIFDATLMQQASDKVLHKLEKTVLEAFIRLNPLSHTEPDQDDTWLLAHHRQYHILPRQLIRVGQLDKAVKIMCNMFYVQQTVKELGVHFMIDQLQALSDALHEGVGKESVFDYLDFVESNSEALTEDPSRIFDLARQEVDVSKVYQDAVRHIAHGETVVRQAQSRISRVEGSSVPLITKAVTYSRAQRSIARLTARGITACFSKSQLEKCKKALQMIGAGSDAVLKLLGQEELDKLEHDVHAFLGTTSHLEGFSKGQAFFDLMDILTRALPPPPPPEVPKGEDKAEDTGEAEAEEDLEGILGRRSLRLFVSCSGEDQLSEMKFLTHYVLPGLRVQCAANHIDFGWCDFGTWSQNSNLPTPLLAGSRLSSLEQCEIHSKPVDSEHFSTQRSPFGLFVVGSRYGEPHLADAALRNEEALMLRYPYLTPHDGMIGVVDAELQHAFISHSFPLSFVLLNDGNFLEDQHFIHEVPEQARTLLLDSATSKSLENLTLQVNEKAAEMQDPVWNESEVGVQFWRVVTYRSKFLGVDKDKKGGQPAEADPNVIKNMRFGGMEMFGIQCYQRLWGIISKTYPRPAALTVWEREESEQETSRYLQCRASVLLPCRDYILRQACDFVTASLSQPDSEEKMIALSGAHGIGLSSILALLTDRLSELHEEGDEESVSIVYFAQKAMHGPRHLLWYLCSSIAEAEASTPSWRFFVDKCAAKTQDRSSAVVFIIDSISTHQQSELLEALHKIGRKGGHVAAIVCGIGGVPAAEPQTAHTITPMLVPELEQASVPLLVDAVLQDMMNASKAPIQPDELQSLTDSVLSALNSVAGPKSGTSGNPLYIVGVCLLAFKWGPSGLQQLGRSLQDLWHDSFLPLFEKTHTVNSSKWALLALLYEPCGLRLSELAYEHGSEAEKKDAKDVLPLDETYSNIGPKCTSMAFDLKQIVCREWADLAQVLILNRPSLRQAVEQRYSEHYKRAEDDFGANVLLGQPSKQRSVLTRIPEKKSNNASAASSPVPDKVAPKHSAVLAAGKSPKKKPTAADTANKKHFGDEAKDPKSKDSDLDNLDFISFFTDVQGSYDYFLRFVALSKALEWSSDDKELLLKDGAGLVFGGNVMDQGIGDIRFAKHLLSLKSRYPERVEFLIGNRDCQKLRFGSELSQEAIDDPAVAEDKLFPYWLAESQRITPQAYLEREGLENDFSSRLKWMLDETMNANDAFERRRMELAFLESQEPSDIADEAVVQSFVSQVDLSSEEAVSLQYLKLGKLVYQFGTTVFSHGALLTENIGVLPLDENEPMKDIKAWVQKINQWLGEQVEEFLQNPVGGKNTSERAAFRLMDIGVQTKSVVNAEWWDLEDKFIGISDEVRECLGNGGVRNIICGHSLEGPCPSVQKDRGFQVVMANTANSEPGHTSDWGVDNRGMAVSEVLIFRDGSIDVHGKLPDGREIEYSLASHSSASQEGRTFDQFIGEDVGEGGQVKAKLKDADQYLIFNRRLEQTSEMSLEQLTKLLGKPEGAEPQDAAEGAGGQEPAAEAAEANGGAEQKAETAEEPTAEEPAAEETAAEETAAEETAAEEQVAEEPAAEDPAAEEPSAADGDGKDAEDVGAGGEEAGEDEAADEDFEEDVEPEG